MKRLGKKMNTDFNIMKSYSATSGCNGVACSQWTNCTAGEWIVRKFPSP